MSVVVAGAGLGELLCPAGWFKCCVLGCNSVSRLGLMARGLAAMGRSMWCARGMNGAP